jgi:hypothetical protein
MERIQAKLLSLDTLKTGRIGVSKFTEIVVSETNLRAMHISHLIRAAGYLPTTFIQSNASTLPLCVFFSSSTFAVGSTFANVF